MTTDDTASFSASSERDALECVVIRYMGELADGRRPDQEEYLRQYPEMAVALREVFKTLGLIDAAGKSLDVYQLKAGQHLGEFRIVREIGRGGMGIVYEAVQTSLNRKVALKVLPVSAMLSDTALERFHRETNTAGRLHHTNIVPVHAVGEQGDICYFAMQYIDGRTLAHFLRTADARSYRFDREHFRRVARWGRQVAEALDYAHQQGVIHRDLKPANLMLDAQDNVWVFDFGLARAANSPTITQTGALLGTVRYMSPEQASGSRVVPSPRADVYSLGATLYELAALRPAFADVSQARLLQRVIHDEPRPLRQLVRTVPRDLDTIIAKCMQRDAARRYADAGEVAEDLQRFLADEPIRARPTPLYVKTRRWIRRHRALSAVALVLVVTLAVAVAVAARLRHSEGLRCTAQAFDAIVFDQDYQRAAALLDRAESLGIESPELHLYRGLIPLLNRRPQAAVPHLERSRESNPAGLDAVYALARARIDLGDYYAGQRLFEMEGARRPGTALGWFLRGYARSGHQPSEAIDCYNNALDLQPSFTPAILERATYRGVRLLTDGARSELEPMFADVDAVVVFRPNASLSHAWRAWAYLAAASYAATQADLQSEHMAWIETSRRELHLATQFHREGEATTMSVQGVFLRYVGDYRGSAEAYGQAIREHERTWGESNTLFVHARAMALHASGDMTTALAECEPACRLTPEFYALVLHRAILLAELGRLEDARRVCRESLEAQRFHATGLIFSAAIAEFLGDAQEARAAVRTLESRGASEVTTEHLDRQPAEADEGQPGVAYLSGAWDSARLMAAAGDNPGRRCEFAFLVALRELSCGNRTAGLSALRTCLGSGVFFYGEHRFAEVFLARAESDPTWPHWTSSNNR